jgi:hypothetical protein
VAIIMNILSYAIRIIVSTFIIWLSIHIVDRGNYRNKLKNAFLTAIILSFAGATPFVFLFGLIIWVFILINWYSIGFFKSFLCVVVYAVIFFFLNLLLVTALVGGAFTYTKMADTSMYAEKWEDFKMGIMKILMKLPKSFRDELGIDEKAIKERVPAMLPGKRARLFLTNGRTITVRILMEGRKGILVDIADGRSEVVIRRDEIEHIDEI